MTTKYHIRRVGDITIVDLSGGLSLGEAVAFALGSGVMLQELVRELTKQDQKKILVNLAEVTYVDSSGIGQLVGALLTARNQGGDLKLLKPTKQVLDVLKTTNLTSVFDVQDDEATVIQSFSKEIAARA